MGRYGAVRPPAAVKGTYAPQAAEDEGNVSTEDTLVRVSLHGAWCTYGKAQGRYGKWQVWQVWQVAGVARVGSAMRIVRVPCAV